MLELGLRWFGAFLLVLPVPALLTRALTVRWGWVGGVVGIVLWDLLACAAFALAFALSKSYEAPRPPDDAPFNSVMNRTETWADYALGYAHGWINSWPLHLFVLVLGLLFVAGGFETRRRRAAAGRTSAPA